MKCPNCSSELLPGDTSSGLLKCEPCNVWLPAPAPTGSGGVAGSAPPEPPRPRGKVSLPARFKVNPSARQLEVSWKWWAGFSWFWLVFAGLWNLITLPMVVFTFLDDDAGLERILLMLPFVLVGLSTGYLALGHLLNSSKLSVSRGELSLSHGPLPYQGKTYRVNQLEQLFCQRYEAGQVNGQPVFAFRVQVLLADGSRPELVSGLGTLEEALYLEQEFEERLNIKNRPVPGEYGT